MFNIKNIVNKITDRVRICVFESFSCVELKWLSR